jgi:hypothetical protein
VHSPLASYIFGIAKSSSGEREKETKKQKTRGDKIEKQKGTGVIAMLLCKRFL